MITRLRDLPLWALSLFVLGLGASACDKVPLLAPSGSTITVTAAATALPLNGTTDIIAQVLEQPGTPPQDGTLVTFLTTLGSIEPPEAQTSGGRVVVKFHAGTTNGTATITATSGGATSAPPTSSGGTTAATPGTGLKIAIGTAAVGSVRVSANPTLLPAIGGSATITALVIDINGNPLSAAPIAFSTTSGSLDQTTVTTDSNGAATAVLRTTTSATVTAAVGAQAGSSTPPPANGGGGGTTATGNATGSVTVNIAGAPTLTITPPTTTPSAGLPATYTFAVTAAASNGSPLRDITVDWGDGSATQHLGAISGNATVSHVYSSSGVYTILATATDAFGNVVTASTSVAVNAKQQPAVSITTTTPSPTANTDIIFTASVAPPANTGTVIQDVTVDYGDGTVVDLGAVTGTSISLHHIYTVGGTFNVVLKATDSNGGVGTAVTSVFVQTAAPLTVILAASATFGTTTTTESFTATVIGLGNAVVVSYLWDFGDGSSAVTTSGQTTHTYAHPSGPFTVRVTITTSTGATASTTTVVSP